MRVELHELSKFDAWLPATADSGLPEPITKAGKSIVSEIPGFGTTLCSPRSHLHTYHVNRMAFDRQSSRVHHVHANVVTRT